MKREPAANRAGSAATDWSADDTAVLLDRATAIIEQAALTAGRDDPDAGAERALVCFAEAADLIRGLVDRTARPTSRGHDATNGTAGHSVGGPASPSTDLLVVCLVNSAMLLSELGRLDAAEESLREAEPLLGAATAERVVAWEDAATATAMRREDWPRALRHADRAVTAGAGLAPRIRLTGLLNLASVCMTTGDERRAARLLDRLVPLARDSGDTGLLVIALSHSGQLALRREDTRVAAGHYAEAAALAMSAGMPASAADARQGLAHIRESQGHDAEAVEEFLAAAGLYDESALPARAADCLALAGAATTGAILRAEGQAGQDMLRRRRTELIGAARIRYRAAGLPGNIAQADLIEAVALHQELTGAPLDDPAVVARLRQAVDLVVPAALTLDVARLAFEDPSRRQQWSASSHGLAWNAAFELAWNTDDVDLVAALVDARRSGTDAGSETSGGLFLPPPSAPGVASPLIRHAERCARVHGTPVIEPGDGASAWGPRGVPADPTVLLTFAEAGDLYLSWQWSDAPGRLALARIPADDVAVVLGLLAEALPVPAHGEDQLAALRRSVRILADPTAERQLAARLASVLLPPPLRAELLARHNSRVRFRPSESLLGVPWELIAVDDAGRRLIDIAEIETNVSTGVSPARVPRWDPEGTRVLVLDPRVPGFAPESRLGSVLGPPTEGTALSGRVRTHRSAGRLSPEVATDEDTFRRRDTNRTWLRKQLDDGCARLLVVAHVSDVAVRHGSPEPAMHLSCSTDLDGWALPDGAHLPLTVRDLTEPMDGSGPWRFPARVALIGCASGADAARRDGLSLVGALLRGGAELVSALRWPVPTGAFLTVLGEPVSDPLGDLAAAADVAHESEDPVSALGQWQRSRLARWRSAPSVTTSPLWWAAVGTTTTR